MELLGITGVASIVVICLLGAQAVKVAGLDTKWLPLLCGSMGGLLGILGMLVMPEFPAQDLLTAAAMGIVSGLAATGSHQIIKQLGNREE